MPKTSVGPTCADLRRDGVAQRHASHPLGPLMRVERAQAARGQGKGGVLRGRRGSTGCSMLVSLCSPSRETGGARYLGISGLSLAEYLWRYTRPRISPRPPREGRARARPVPVKTNAPRTRRAARQTSTRALNEQCLEVVPAHLAARRQLSRAARASQPATSASSCRACKC